MQAAPNAAPVTPAFTPASGPESIPELNELEDLLYDLLATGAADANVAASVLEAAQSFLHEHARARKTHSEFVAFFTEHKLPLRPERLNLLALPALDVRGRASEAPVLVPAQAPEPPPPVQLMAAAADSGEVARPARAARTWLLSAVFAAISCVAALAAVTLLELRAELTRMHEEAMQSAATLEQLRREAEGQRARLKELSESVQRHERDLQDLLRVFGSSQHSDSQ